MGERSEHRVIRVKNPTIVNVLIFSKSLDCLEVVEGGITEFFKGRVLTTSKILYENGRYWCCLQLIFSECASDEKG